MKIGDLVKYVYTDKAYIVLGVPKEAPAYIYIFKKMQSGKRTGMYAVPKREYEVISESS